MNDTGYIYFIQEEYNGPVKIGTSVVSPEARLSGLQTGNPHELHFIGRFVVDIEDAERKIHDFLKGFCIRGEWYESKAARDLLKLWRDTGTWAYKTDTVLVTEIKDKVGIEQEAVMSRKDRAIWDGIDKAFR